MRRVVFYFLGLCILIFGFTGCGSSIHSFAAKGDIKALDKELKNGANIEARYNGDTALHRAAWNGRLEVIRYLVKQGANIEARDKYGEPAIKWAAWRGKLKVVKCLVEQGANIEAKDKYGDSPLDNAAENGKLEVVKYLVEQGANIEAKDKHGNTPLFTAAYFGKLEVVKYLVEQGANIEAKNKNGSTPLEWAKNDEIKKYFKLVKEKEAMKQKEIKQKQEIIALEKKGDLVAIKEYTDKYPNSVYFISNETLRLALTGPKGMKVGDIRKLLKDGQSESIVISLIKRVKEPYKEYTIEEINLLLKMGLPDKIVSAMIDVTTKLLENQERRKEQELLLAEQKKISKQKGGTTIINNTTVNKNSDSGSNAVQDELMKQGTKMLFDKLF